jgi:hypothetical protein
MDTQSAIFSWQLFGIATKILWQALTELALF